MPQCYIVPGEEADRIQRQQHHQGDPKKQKLTRYRTRQEQQELSKTTRHEQDQESTGTDQAVH